MEKIIWRDLKVLNGEGNGNALQYSCLENPMDRGVWCTFFLSFLKLLKSMYNLIDLKLLYKEFKLW